MRNFYNHVFKINLTEITGLVCASRLKLKTELFRGIYERPSTITAQAQRVW